MELSPHVNFDGRCREAFHFYAKTFGGHLLMEMTYGESPLASRMPPEMMDKVIHSRLDLGGPLLMGCDAPPDRYQSPQGIQFSVSFVDVAQAERIFNTLAKDGTVDMPFEETFWAHRFGMCTDRFGITWMVNCEKG